MARVCVDHEVAVAQDCCGDFACGAPEAFERWLQLRQVLRRPHVAVLPACMPYTAWAARRSIVVLQDGRCCAGLGPLVSVAFIAGSGVADGSQHTQCEQQRNEESDLADGLGLLHRQDLDPV